MTLTHNATFYDLVGATEVLNADISAFQFNPDWLVLLYDDPSVTPLLYQAMSALTPNVHKVVISPIGAPYPGDDVAGHGPQRVTIVFNTTPAILDIVLNQIDNVNVQTAGWVIVTNDTFIVAFAAHAVQQVRVEPVP